MVLFQCLKNDLTINLKLRNQIVILIELINLVDNNKEQSFRNSSISYINDITSKSYIACVHAAIPKPLLT